MLFSPLFFFLSLFFCLSLFFSIFSCLSFSLFFFLFFQSFSLSWSLPMVPSWSLPGNPWIPGIRALRRGILGIQRRIQDPPKSHPNPDHLPPSPPRFWEQENSQSWNIGTWPDPVTMESGSGKIPKDPKKSWEKTPNSPKFPILPTNHSGQGLKQMEFLFYMKSGNKKFQGNPEGSRLTSPGSNVGVGQSWAGIPGNSSLCPPPPRREAPIIYGNKYRE